MNEDKQVEYLGKLEYWIDEMRKIMDGTYTVWDYQNAIETHAIEIVRVMTLYNPDYWMRSDEEA